MIGSVLVILIIFLFLRNFRSTLIVCTSIPDFGHRHVRAALLRRLDAEHDDVRRSGARRRHDRRRGDRRARELVPAHGASRQGPDDGVDRRQRGSLVGDSGVDPDAHRRVRAAALPRRASRASCSGSCRSSSCFSLAMSLFVAVTLVPVLCSRCSCCRRRRTSARASADSSTRCSERALDGMDDGLPRACCTWRSAIGRSSSALAAASVVAAAIILPTLPTEFATQTDEGQVQVSAELAQGTRIEVTDPVLQRLESAIAELVPEATDVIVSAGGGGPGFGGPGGGGAVNRGQLQLLLKPKDERKRSSDQIAQDLRRQLAGIPGVIVRANASGGNQQMNRFLSGGNNGGGRLSLEIRGESLDDARKIAQATKDLLDTRAGRRRRAPGPRRWPAGAGGPQSTARRRRCSASAPRPSRTRSARTSPARRRRSSARAARNIRSSSACVKTSGRTSATSSDVLVSTPTGR